MAPSAKAITPTRFATNNFLIMLIAHCFLGQELIYARISSYRFIDN